MKCPHCHSDLVDDSRFCNRCGRPIQASPEDQASFTRTLAARSAGAAPGTLLAGKYRILEEIGRGGMGVVYKAEDLKLKRTVALKFLPPEWIADGAARERFIQEARAAAALSHPNICTIHEVNDSEDKPFIVMEYIEGDSLRDKIKKGPLPIQDALAFALQAAEGLERAHQKGIIHRDIKSANLMVTESGQVKIMDFGLAKLGGESSFTKEGTTLGTVAYMSPEQARGEKVNGRTDLWSLGVVLYDLVTGELPFQGERDISVLYSIVHEAPKSLKDKKPPVPSELQRIIEKALQKNPDSRYQSAAEMREDLARYQDALKAESAGVFNLPSLLKRLRRPAVLGPSVAVLIALAALAAWFFHRQAKVRWARYEILPQVDQLSKEGYQRFPEAYALAVKAEKYIPGDTRLAALFRRVSIPLSISTDPPGAKASIAEYKDAGQGWKYLGLSPIDNLRSPIEYLRFKIEKEGYEPVSGAAFCADIDWRTIRFIPIKIFRKLDKAGSLPPGMVRVAGVEDKGLGAIDDFFMDRCEVTNRQYKDFMDQGGYQNRNFWRNKFIKEGKELSWEQAMAEFVDSTGRPGPATWQGGDFAEGQDDYPVSGVSWYEAAAYAEFAGKSLPTGIHWGLACGNQTTLFTLKGFSEFFTPQSNFKDRGPDRVGRNPAITAYGLSDMGGNVREWCWNETQLGRLVRGGAWNDVPYMFGNWSQLPPLDRSAKNGFRCAFYVHPERIPPSVLDKVEVSGLPDFYKQKPVPDSVFQVYKDQFSYDPHDLKARVEWRDETSRDWIQEKVSFEAAYDHERVFGYLFLPRNSSPPFQTVIYFPGSTSAYARSSKDMDKWVEFLPFIVKNGRALLYPVYKGTFERGDDALTEIHGGDDSHQYTEFFIKVVKDFRRSVDYLETRPDIDGQKLAYLGVSWGGVYGAIIPAVEDRLKVSVLRVGGLKGIARPEVNEINYVGRVTIPTLMLNGRYDMTFPYELSVKPMFDLLGTPPDRKELKLYDTDHFIPFNAFVKETLVWLDKYLGPVKK
jgi:dienelactone hydrolase/predicted Ser/Thr protein kinase